MICRPSCDSIIFDLDGTLWDASSATAKGWSRIAQDLNISVSINADSIRSVSGLPFDQCVAKIFPDQFTNMPDLIEKLDQAEKEEVLKHGAELYPGVQEWLPKLSKQYRLFLVSNCQDWYLKAFLEKSNLSQYFSDSLCLGQTGQSKSKNIQDIIRKNSLKKSIYVGDTDWDQSAAYYAGVNFVFVSYGFGSINTDRYPTADTFAKFAEWMLSPKSDKPQIDVRKLKKADFDDVKKFYLSVQYTQALDPESFYYGAYHDAELVGVVRLAKENDILVLRGMQVRAAYQFLGIGTRLIKTLELDLADQECFCLPYGWLAKFYGQIGFNRVIGEQEIPKFLHERLQQYSVPEMIIMKRNAIPMVTSSK